MGPLDSNIFLDELRGSGGSSPGSYTPVALSAEKPMKRDAFDAIESFDLALEKHAPSPGERPSFHDASEEEHVTPHTTTDEL